MAHFIEFELEDGSSVLIEVPEEKRGMTQAGGKDLINKATQTLDKALQSVKHSFLAVNNCFKDMNISETEISASIKLTSEGNFVIGKVKGEGTLEVKLKWKHDNSES